MCINIEVSNVTRHLPLIAVDEEPLPSVSICPVPLTTPSTNTVQLYTPTCLPRMVTVTSVMSGTSVLLRNVLCTSLTTPSLDTPSSLPSMVQLTCVGGPLEMLKERENTVWLASREESRVNCMAGSTVGPARKKIVERS